MPAFSQGCWVFSSAPADRFTTRPAPEDLQPILSAQEIEDVLAYLMTPDPTN